MEPMSSANGVYHVLTWNVGSDADLAKIETLAQPKDKFGLAVDYGRAVQEHGKEEGTKKYDADSQALSNYRNSRIKVILDSLNPDIMCLQEVGRDLPKVKKWFDTSKYEVLNGDGEDATIVYNKKKFDLITTENPRNRANYAIAELVDKQTKKSICVVSAHLRNAGDPVELSGDGDEEVDIILKHTEEFKKKHKTDAVVIGLDANAIRDYQGRIGKLQKANFEADPYNRSTNIQLKNERKKNPTDEVTVKIDHICVQKLNKSVKMERVDEKIQTLVDEIPLGYKPKENPSDHKPVMVKVTVAPSSSWW